MEIPHPAKTAGFGMTNTIKLEGARVRHAYRRAELSPPYLALNDVIPNEVAADGESFKSQFVNQVLHIKRPKCTITCPVFA